MQQASFVIHFDSLFWPLDNRAGMSDPSFDKIAGRFFEMSEKYNFKYTIFVIGKDLENPEVAARIKSWSEAGHEIGSHSYSHDINLGVRGKEKIKEEVLRAHELICRVTGKEPRGFVSPGWCISDDLLEVLEEAGYLYDTSSFPSYFIFPMLLKLAALNKHDPGRQPTGKNIEKSLSNFLAQKKPYKKNKVTVMPMPVTPVLQIPCWHTASFIFGKYFFNRILKRCLSAHDKFYYIMHPADLADLNDVPAELRKKMEVFERISVPLAEKKEHFNLSLQTILNAKKEIVTLRQMADGI